MTLSASLVKSFSGLKILLSDMSSCGSTVWGMEQRLINQGTGRWTEKSRSGVTGSAEYYRLMCLRRRNQKVGDVTLIILVALLAPVRLSAGKGEAQVTEYSIESPGVCGNRARIFRESVLRIVGLPTEEYVRNLSYHGPSFCVYLPSPLRHTGLPPYYGLANSIGQEKSTLRANLYGCKVTVRRIWNRFRS
jgi:hypothetical protein